MERGNISNVNACVPAPPKPFPLNAFQLIDDMAHSQEWVRGFVAGINVMEEERKRQVKAESFMRQVDAGLLINKED